MLQDVGYDHLPILLIVPISLGFRPNERLPSFNFQKARWNDFAYYFDSHCPSAEEYPSLSSAAVLFTSQILNALLTIWCKQTALFLSLLAKPALAYLPTALSVALRLPFSFQQAQYGQVFPLQPASSLLVLAAPTSLPLLFFYLTLVPFFLFFNLFGRSGRNCFLSPPVLSGYNGSPDIRFSRGTTRLMSWPDGERYLRPPQSLEVSLLFSFVSILLFSRTEGVLSHRNSLTHRFPQFPRRNLYFHFTLAVFSLAFAATDTAYL